MPITMSQYQQLFQLDRDVQTKLANLDELTDMSYDEWPSEYDKVMRVTDSDRESEQDFAVGGFPLPQESAGEFGALNYAVQNKWFPQTYVFATYSLGFLISHNMKINDKWNLGGMRAKWLGRSFRRLPEVLTARMFNEGFSATTPTGVGNGGRRSPDGRPLFDTAHPYPGGGTYSNTFPSGGAALNHANLQAMMIRMAQRTDDQGMPVHLDMKTLLVPVGLYPTALEVLNSSFRTDTLNRVKNVLPNVMSIQPVMNHYLVDQDAWFGIAEPSQTGLRFIWREKPNRNMWEDPRTRGISYGIWCELDYGWSHPMGSEGSPG